MNKSAFTKPFEATAVKKDGRIRLRNQKAFEAFSAAMREGQEFLVTFERAHATRSLDQNAVYWAGYVHPIAEYTGYTPKEVHAYLKRRFLPKQKIEIVDKRSGVVVDQVDLESLTTTTLNKVEFSEYLSEIKDFAESIGVSVGSNREAA